MVKRETGVTKEHVRGGNGSVEFFHILSEAEMLGHGTMFAKVVLKPHSSIGWHQHIGNTEPYYVIEGEGLFIDNDGSKTTVKPGDICTIEVGQSHSIENNTDKDFAMIALIINEAAK